MKTIKVYNEENVNINVEFDKVTKVDFYGTDAAFNFTVTDKETGIELERSNITIKNVFNGFDTCEDVENFFEINDIDGDEYDWEIPEDMKDKFNEYINELYSEIFYDCNTEEIESYVKPYLKDIYNELGINDYLYYIDNDKKKIDFIHISTNSDGHRYIDAEDVEELYDMNTESIIYKYKKVYFSFFGKCGYNYTGFFKSANVEILKRTNEKKKVTTDMVENYGIPALTYDLVGKYVYMYETIYI